MYGLCTPHRSRVRSPASAAYPLCPTHSFGGRVMGLRRCWRSWHGHVPMTRRRNALHCVGRSWRPSTSRARDARATGEDVAAARLGANRGAAEGPGGELICACAFHLQRDARLCQQGLTKALHAWRPYSAHILQSCQRTHMTLLCRLACMPGMRTRPFHVLLASHACTEAPA